MTKQRIIFKVLRNGKSCKGDKETWNLPIKQADGSWLPGEWMPTIKGELVSYRNGYHLCNEEVLIDWLDNEIYEAEYDGDMFNNNGMIVVRRARLLRKFDNWNDKTARLVACWCVRNTVMSDTLTDELSTRAIDVLDRYEKEKASEEELQAIIEEIIEDTLPATQSITHDRCVGVRAAQTKHLLEVIENE